MTGPAPLRLFPLLGAAPDTALLELLALRLATFLRVPVRVDPAIEIPLSPGEGRTLSSNAIVDWMIGRDGGVEPSPPEWRLVITTADLTVTGRDLVFGEAALHGSWAVVSTARLAPPAARPQESLDRVFKESLHEIGHLAGLGHCSSPHCVMNRSDSLSRVDAKEADFCHSCTTRFFQSMRP